MEDVPLTVMPPPHEHPHDRLSGARPASVTSPDLSAWRGYARYALYFAPMAEHPLGAFGRRWLGRDPETGGDMPPPPIEGLDPSEITALTEGPARYGFHATLKAPFAMAGGYTLHDLDRSITALAGSLQPVRLSPMRLDLLNGFLALVPPGSATSLNNLADRCVVVLDRMRAPLTPEDRCRRLKDGLSPRQLELLDHWGYPYVLDEFRFHMTLTGRLDPARAKRIMAAMAGPLAALTRHALSLSDIALFGDPGAGAPFRLLKRYPLGHTP